MITKHISSPIGSPVPEIVKIENNLTIINRISAKQAAKRAYLMTKISEPRTKEFGKIDEKVGRQFDTNVSIIENESQAINL